MSLRYPAPMLLRRLPTLLLAFASLPTLAQTGTGIAKPDRAVPAALRPYLGCKLPGGPQLVQHTLLPHAPMTRAAQTLTGPKAIRLVDGTLAAFAFPNSAPFANVKIEQLPASAYTAEKADLISEFDKINAKGEDTQRNYALKPTLNGFEIYGFDRTALDGNVLGIYLFFDNTHHIATTAYFLNAPQGQRRFSTIADYSDLRQHFLNDYTACVHNELTGSAPAHKSPIRQAHRH